MWIIQAIGSGFTSEEEVQDYSQHMKNALTLDTNSGQPLPVRLTLGNLQYMDQERR